METIQDLQSLKTSQMPLVPTKVRTSDSCSKRSSKSSSRHPRCLRCRVESGPTTKKYPLRGICSQLENAIVFKLKDETEGRTAETQ